MKINEETAASQQIKQEAFGKLGLKRKRVPERSVRSTTSLES